MPTEFRLLKRGMNDYDEDDQILFDDEAAAETLKRYRAKGIDLMADYEHMSLSVPAQIAPASAKRWVPEVRGGDLMATQIAWTEKAKAMLAAGEYRYFSIACKVDTKSKRCVELMGCGFALTNNPAGHGIEALVAASRKLTDESDDEENMSKTIIVALGLGADAEESVAVAKAASLTGLERDVLELTKAKSVSEALEALRANAKAGEQVVALNAKVRFAEFDALVKQGLADKKITPAQAKPDGSVGELRAREDGVELLKKRLRDAAAIVEKPGEGPREGGAGGGGPIDPAAVQLTEQEIKIAKDLVGNNPVALKKHLGQLRAYKAARASGQQLDEAIMTATARQQEVR